MAKPIQDEFVTLGCIYSKGRYPKFKTERLKKGLRFIEAQLRIQKIDFDKLNEDLDFVALMRKGEIFRLKPGTKYKNPSAPKVVHGATTLQGAGSPAENSSRPAVDLETADENPSGENAQ